MIYERQEVVLLQISVALLMIGFLNFGVSSRVIVEFT
jgi:hypothetical protein